MADSYANLSAYMSLPNADMLGENPYFFQNKDLEFYSSARAILLSIALDFQRTSPQKKLPTLHIPEFFCPALFDFLEKYFTLKKYAVNLDLASMPEIKISEEEYVLAVNYFGLFDKKSWENFSKQNPKAILIEDHSHAPFSEAALNSKAQYSFASLRKVLPLPSGAYLKTNKRRLRKLFRQGSKTLDDFESVALASLVEKKFFLESANFDAKKIFQSFERAEEILSSKPPRLRISEFSLSLAKNFRADLAAEMRFKNFKAFAEMCAKFECLPFKIFNQKTLEFPYSARDIFYPVLMFEDLKSRNLYRQKLKDLGAEPPIYWSILDAASMPCKALSESLLCIPLDYRFSEKFSSNLAKKMCP